MTAYILLSIIFLILIIFIFIGNKTKSKNKISKTDKTPEQLKLEARKQKDAEKRLAEERKRAKEESRKRLEASRKAAEEEARKTEALQKAEAKEKAEARKREKEALLKAKETRRLQAEKEAAFKVTQEREAAKKKAEAKARAKAEAEKAKEATITLPEYPAFDHSRLLEMGLSDEEAKEFATELIEQIETQLPLIKEAIQASDFHQIERLTHSIKGSATNIGTGGVADLLIDYNTYLKSGNDSVTAKVYYTALTQELQKLKTQYL